MNAHAHMLPQATSGRHERTPRSTCAFACTHAGLKCYFKVHKVHKQTDRGNGGRDLTSAGELEGEVRRSARVRAQANAASDLAQKFRGTIFLVAGYSAHSTRYVYAELIQRLATEGFVVVTFDFCGHGYSEGERCLIYDTEDMLDDWQLCVQTVLQSNSHLKESSWWICGQSMGGGLALLLSLRAQDFQKGQDSQARIYANFSG